MDWVLRAAVILFLLVVAILLLLEAIHVVSRMVRDWQEVRDASTWLNRKARDEARSVAQLYSSERDVIATPRKKP